MAFAFSEIGAIMRIGISVWRDRVSPVFDTATKLRIVEIDDNRVTTVRNVQIPRLMPWQKARFISQTGPDLIICGAISRFLAREIQAHQIAILPWIRGSVEEVLAAYQAGRLHSNGFMLPGCQGGKCRQRRRSGKRTRGPRRGAPETEGRV